MTIAEIRQKYLDFFKSAPRNHVVIPSASLVPENDPTTLFTGSGMQPLLPYLLGQPHPAGKRLVDSQKSFRAQDIEEVGDNRHTTFFEMLGNWSLGDYFKQEQLPWFFEFLTKEVGLDPKRLYVSVFSGGYGIEKDEESIAIWKKLFAERGISAEYAEMNTEEEGSKRGMKTGEHIFGYKDKNWWSRAGSPEKMPAGEPGGPDSEVFYEFENVEHDLKFGEHCHPNCDCGRFLEIGNSVFMQYVKNADGSFSELPQKNVDFGGGLERITAAAEGNSDVFMSGTLHSMILLIESETGSSYKAAPVEEKQYFRIVADHLRAAVFLIAEGTTPGSQERNYIVRRLLRRGFFFADRLAIHKDVFSKLIKHLATEYGNQYPELEKNFARIEEATYQEVSKFEKTLTQGMLEFETVVTVHINDSQVSKDLNPIAVFNLVTTYGFPFELVRELASERGLRINELAFARLMEDHRQKSRAGAEQKFKGGLADTSEQSVKYHTATHLLHQALRTVLGPHVSQKGSNITPERLRFDFSHTEKMTPEQIATVETIVNEQIAAGIPVTYEDIPKEEAERRGAIGLFEEKYGDTVRVYKIGDFSLEYCGGPHVANTKEIGKFKIVKEEAVAAGIRRIKAVVE